ncbi:hypothetical protein CRUP_013645 [Coryphaenoides rupestris]|nr:hypothetical protein CRUP_013645 [Coryphaenoides rupestris]
MIKVISKPSQKRQSMKNADRSRVALFNRLRSQTVSTRFLSVERPAAVASGRRWTPFTITLVQGPDQGDYVLSEGFICYSSVVQLVCTETGVALPPMPRICGLQSAELAGSSLQLKCPDSRQAGWGSGGPGLRWSGGLVVWGSGGAGVPGGSGVPAGQGVWGTCWVRGSGVPAGSGGLGYLPGSGGLGYLLGQRVWDAVRGTSGVLITCSALFLEVIRKVNKQHAILDVDEPVSQLHKCSFQFRETAQSYLCLSNDSLIQHQGSSTSRDPGRVVLSDGCCWTIIGVEAVEFSFNQNLAPLHSLVSPVPVITGLQVSGGGHVATLEVQGENFTPHLKIWFSCQESETMFRSLLCVIPDVSVFGESWPCARRVITVPLSLVRSDGLIYRSTYSFTYTPELHPPPPHRGAGGGAGGGSGGRRKEGGTQRGEEDDALLDSIHQEFTRANFHLFMQS